MFSTKLSEAQTKAIKSPTSKLEPQRSTLAARRFAGAVDKVLKLQRSIGNQATLRLLSQRAWGRADNQLGDMPMQETERMHLSDRAAAPGWSLDFSKKPVFPLDLSSGSQTASRFSAPTAPAVNYPKLAVGEANDPLEREADMVADHVMRRPDPELSIAPAPAQPGRKCTACKEEDRQQFQTKAATAGTPLAVSSEAPGIVHEVLRAPGQPLDCLTRAFMEPRLGHDFSGVRVHDDGRSVDAARAVNARAFTTANHIVLAKPLDKSSKDGCRLLAHELAHVVQQSASERVAGPVPVQRQPASQSFEDDPLSTGGFGPLDTTIRVRPGSVRATLMRPQIIPQLVGALLQQTEEGRWALNVMRTQGVDLLYTQDGPVAFYNPKTNSCTLNTSLAPEIVASYFVHEMYHAEQQRTGKSGDPKKMAKGEYVNVMVEEEIQGTVRGYEAYLELEKKGQLPSNARFPPRFDFFRSAYKTGRDLAQKANPAASENELHRAGLKRAEAAIRYFVKERGLGPHAGPGGLGMTYAEYYSADWERAH